MTDNGQPMILPEDCVPPHYAACSRCELADQRQRVIWGEGNPLAPIMIVLDNPGAREDREGNEFVCGTRITLQEGLSAAGIALTDVYVTYLLKCRPIRKYDKPAARLACKPFLEEQLERYEPKLLFCLGDVVVQSVFANPDTSVKSLRGRWHTTNGIPVAVSYHPLAVRRRPVLFPLFVEDCNLIAEMKKNLSL